MHDFNSTNPNFEQYCMCIFCVLWKVSNVTFSACPTLQVLLGTSLAWWERFQFEGEAKHTLTLYVGSFRQPFISDLNLLDRKMDKEVREGE